MPSERAAFLLGQRVAGRRWRPLSRRLRSSDRVAGVRWTPREAKQRPSRQARPGSRERQVKRQCAQRTDGRGVGAAAPEPPRRGASALLASPESAVFLRSFKKWNPLFSFFSAKRVILYTNIGKTFGVRRDHLRHTPARFPFFCSTSCGVSRLCNIRSKIGQTKT